MNRIRFYNNELDPPNNDVKLGKGSKVLRVDTRDYTVNLSPKIPESKHTQNYIVSPQLTFNLLLLFKTTKFVCSNYQGKCVRHQKCQHKAQSQRNGDPSLIPLNYQPTYLGLLSEKVGDSLIFNEDNKTKVF